MQRALVIGAGLSGLTAALRTAQAAPGSEIVVLERSTRLGGQIWTERAGDVLIERGGEGFVFRSEAVPALADSVGVADQLMGQAVFTSYGFGERGLLALAPGEAATYLGFQVPREELGRGIRTLRGGMGSLVDGLAQAVERAGVRVRRGITVERVTDDGDALRAHCSDATVLEASCIAAATTAADAAVLLAPLLDAELRDALSTAATVSSVTVELELERAAIDHPLDGTGFVVASALQEHGLRACTFTTSKFEGRAPHDRVLLRAFFRPDPSDAELSDQAWLDRASAGLRRVLAFDGEPKRGWVSRWPNALPVHSPAYAAAVARAEAALHPRGVCLAGAAFHGSGIDAAVRSGDNAALFLAAALTTKQARPR